MGATGTSKILVLILKLKEVLLLTSDSWIIDMSPTRKSDPALRVEVGSFPVGKGLFLVCRLEEQPASQSQGLQVTDPLGTHHGSQAIAMWKLEL